MTWMVAVAAVAMPRTASRVGTPEAIRQEVTERRRRSESIEVHHLETKVQCQLFLNPSLRLRAGQATAPLLSPGEIPEVALQTRKTEKIKKIRKTKRGRTSIFMTKGLRK